MLTVLQTGSSPALLHSAHEKTLTVGEIENRADQATGSLYLNLKSFKAYCGCLSQKN